MTSREKNSIMWRKVRLRMDLSQKEFGQKLGVGAGYVSEIESGKKEPSYTLSELFRYICMQSSEPIDNNVEENTFNTNEMIGKEENEMLGLELIKAQKKVIELLEENSILKEKLLGKPNPSTRKAI